MKYYTFNYTEEMVRRTTETVEVKSLKWNDCAFRFMFSDPGAAEIINNNGLHAGLSLNTMVVYVKRPGNKVGQFLLNLISPENEILGHELLHHVQFTNSDFREKLEELCREGATEEKKKAVIRQYQYPAEIDAYALGLAWNGKSEDNHRRILSAAKNIRKFYQFGEDILVDGEVIPGVTLEKVVSDLKERVRFFRAHLWMFLPLFRYKA